MIPNGSKPPLPLEREMKTAEGVSEAAVGDRKPVVAGRAEQGRVKVERGAKRPDLEAVLRSEQVGP